MPTAEKNLLIGILALRHDLVSKSHVVKAFERWLVDRSQSIDRILVSEGTLTVKQQQFVVSLAQKYLELFQSDDVSSLTSLGQLSSFDTLARELDDEDLDKTVGATVADDRTRTSHTSSSDDDKRSTTETRGRYRILRPHAKGGLGLVSVAEDLELHREVALKEIQQQFAHDVISQQRFVLEAEITGKLEHPGIVPVYSLGKAPDGQPYYAMRFIQGDSLQQAIDGFYKDGKTSSVSDFELAIRKLLRRFVDVCNAIEYAHSRGVLHRDLKPGNIMLGKYGETLVVDWGLAKTIGKTDAHLDTEEPTLIADSGSGSSHTHMGTLIGTLTHMSPEQARGQIDRLTPAADVYCLGGTLYGILTGAAPIPRGEKAVMIEKILKGDIAPPRTLNPRIPKALEAICLRALALEPASRYPTAAALAEDVEQWLADEPVTAYRESLVERSGRWIRRHRTLVATSGAAMIVGLLATILFGTWIQLQNVALRRSRDAEAQQRGRAEVAVTTVQAQRERMAQVIAQMLDAAEKDLAGVAPAAGYRTKAMNIAYDETRHLAGENDVSPTINSIIAKTARYSGNQVGRTSDFGEAERRLKESIEHQLKLLNGSEPATEYDIYGETLRDLANIQRNLGKLSEALTSIDSAIRVAHELKVKEPGNESYQRSHAIAEFYKASVLYDFGDIPTALQLNASALITLKKLATKPEPRPTDATMAVLAANLYCRLILDSQDSEKAVQVYAEAIKFVESIQSNYQNDSPLQATYARLLANSIEPELKLNRLTDDSRQRLDKALQILQRLDARNNLSIQTYYLDSLRINAMFYAASGDTRRATEQLDQAKKIADALLAKPNLPPELRFSAVNLLRDEALLHRQNGDEPLAAERTQAAKDLLDSIIKLRPEKKIYQLEMDKLNSR